MTKKTDKYLLIQKVHLNRKMKITISIHFQIMEFILWGRIRKKVPIRKALIIFSKESKNWKEIFKADWINQELNNHKLKQQQEKLFLKEIFLILQCQTKQLHLKSKQSILKQIHRTEWQLQMRIKETLRKSLNFSKKNQLWPLNKRKKFQRNKQSLNPKFSSKTRWRKWPLQTKVK